MLAKSPEPQLGGNINRTRVLSTAEEGGCLGDIFLEETDDIYQPLVGISSQAAQQ